MRGRLALVLWAAAVGGAIAVLARLGTGDLATPPLTEPSELGAWVEDRGGAVAAFACFRLVALALAWYLLGATVVGLVVRLVGAAAAVSVADALTVPLVRRLLESALAAGLTLGAVPPAPVTPAAVPVALVADVGHDATATMRLIQEAPPPPTPAAPAPDTYVVQRGDHLWAIAERVTGERLGRPATDAEVIPYWRRLIDANAPADPDLIFAGEVLTLPDP